MLDLKEKRRSKRASFFVMTFGQPQGLPLLFSWLYSFIFAYL